MKLFKLSFKENPCEYTAKLIKELGFNPLKTLLISPTQRFKNYFASIFLKISKVESLISPTLITSDHLILSLLASRGLPLANDVERVSMLFTACMGTNGIEKLFSLNAMKSFSSFMGASHRILKGFDELNTGEVDINDIDLWKNPLHAYPLFKEHLRIFRALYNNYYSVQKEKNRYDPGFLMSSIGTGDMKTYFRDYDTVILFSPLSLSRFERRIFDFLSEKLFVIYQDTEDYDFSNVLTYKAGGEPSALGSSGKRYFFNAPSRMAELMMVLSMIKKNVEEGINPEDIAVLNMDSTFSEMLYDSLISLGFQVNYTEGITIKKSALFRFFDLIGRFFQSSFSSPMFLEILKNPLFSEMAQEKYNPSFLENIRKEVIRRRIFNLSSDMDILSDNESIKEAFNLLKNIYHSKGFDELYQHMLILFKRLVGKWTYEFYRVREILLNSALELKDLNIGVKEAPFDLLLQYVKNKRYPVLGEYSQGIQIIGLLETRGISFKVLMVPTFNDGFFPVKTDRDFYLNTELRKNLGLSTLLDREELEFYYLKRVVDSSDRAYFISLTDKTGKLGLRSRFYYLLRDFSENLPEEQTYVLPVVSNYKVNFIPEISPPDFTKSIVEFSRLDIDKIRKCETRYYISRVLDIKEEDVLESRIELNRVGQKVHELFSELYGDGSLDTTIQGRSYYEKRLIELFEKYFADGFFFTREEVLLKRILKNNLLTSLGRDLHRFQEGYRVLSELIERDFVANIGTGDERYSLRGRIDRIDRSPTGGYIIIDYKTGSLPEIKDHLKKSEFREIQLGFYGILLQKTYPDFNIQGLCYFDLSRKKDIEEVIPSDEIGIYLKDFEEFLLDLLKSFNDKKTLSLTDDRKNCRYCPYFNICRILEG